MSGIVTAAVVIGGATIGAASMASSGMQDAANTAAGAQLSAQQQQQQNFNLVQSQEAPYRQLGEQSLPELQKMLSGGYDMKQSPSAQYAMQMGTKSINSNLGARGLEGNAVQQLGQLSSNTAAQDYQNRFNQLLSATNIGSNAVAMTGSGVNSLNSNLQSGASNLGNIAMANGNTQAGLIGGAAGNLGGLGSSMIGALNTPSQYPGMTYSNGGYTYNNPGSVGPPISAMPGGEAVAV